MSYRLSFLLIASALAQHAFAVTPQQIQIDLAKTLSRSSEVILTTNPSNSTEFTQRWTIYSKSRPDFDVAVKPATVEDVQKIVQYATKNSLSFLATGGGNGYSTSLSSLNCALNIDLGKFRRLIVDTDSSTMTVGASTTFADMFDPLYAAGKQFRKFRVHTYRYKGEIDRVYSI